MKTIEEADKVNMLYKISLLHKPIVHILLIVIIALIAYSNTFHVPFQFDDKPYIAENSAIKDFQYFIEPSKIEKIKLSYPLSNILVQYTFKKRLMGSLTFAINYKLHGFNVTGYHIFNLSIHIINALLVYWFVLLTFQTPSLRMLNSEHRTHLIALFSSLLFVSHPIQTQAVTYITQRFASLATLFYLLSMVMYVKFRTQNLPSGQAGTEHRAQSTDKRQKTFSLSSVFWYLGSVLSAVLAMKTKEIAFTLPVVIILFEFMFFDNLRSTKEITKKLLYLTPLILTILIIPLSLIPKGNTMENIDEATRALSTMSRWDYLFTQFRVTVTYIRLLFLPINQNLDYDYPIYNSFLNPNVFLSFLFLLSVFGLGVYLFYYSKKYSTFILHPSSLRLTAFGIFWFFITLSVESSIIPTQDIIFEHRLYLSSIGVFVAIITSIFIITAKLQRKWETMNKGIVLLFIVIIISLAGTTYSRNTVWSDEIRLWEDVVKKSPNKARGHINLGLAYDSNNLTDKAIEHLQTALKLNPDSLEAHIDLGKIYDANNLPDKAIEHLQTALKLNPDSSEAYNNLGLVYAKKGEFDVAVELYNKAIALNPYHFTSYVGRGNVYDDKNQPDKAIEDYNKAISLNPDYATAYLERGITYMRIGKLGLAILDFQRACDMRDNDACAQLGHALEKK
ncbi:MAG: tetratricopeptide repeat protein [Nitrospirae bacterium]|nr:tetratricopeptide repeat protein [Nitrospirota bacterium]